MDVLSAATSNIVQQAFRELELRPPSSFGDDSEEAQAAAERYDDALRACLEHADWSFARRFADLPEAQPGTGYPIHSDYAYTYALPGDFVAVREVPSGARWLQTELFLLADEAGPLKVRYTRLITNESLLPASFRLAVSLQLAVELAPRWMAAISKREALLRKANTQLASAARRDAHAQGSPGRWDGRPAAGDWADEATR